MKLAPTATAVAAAVRDGRTSAVAEARAALARIATWQEVEPATWISRFEPVGVLEMAATVDRRLAAGEALPLAGATFAVKDNIDVAGLPTTAACPAFAYAPDGSAPVVQALVAAGAIPVGKTNLDQFATGLVGTRSPYGAPGCVFNRSYVSGGSSSGSAVAVAAGLVSFALGTDTAGSGRVPAAFNGLVGFKPSRGLWSGRGVVPACRTLDCVSLFAQDVEDAMRIHPLLSVFDREDPFSRVALDNPALGTEFPFAVPEERQLGLADDREAQLLFRAVVERLRAIGGTPVEVDITVLLEAGSLLYGGPWVAERSTVAEWLLADDPGALDPVVGPILMDGLGLRAVDGFRTMYRLAELKRASERIWDMAEGLLLPTAPAGLRKREIAASPVALNARLGRLTSFANLLDMCAIALPAGYRGNRTGFGISLLGPAFGDLRLLALARRYEEIAPMPEKPPYDIHGVPEWIRIAVVGAHLEGMPLHWQLQSRNAELISRTSTAAAYRLYAMAATDPPKPALIYSGSGGAAIEVEVYALEVAAFGSFVAEVPPPLAIGTVELADGSFVKGFVAEPRALEGAHDITDYGGWRSFVRAKA